MILLNECFIDRSLHAIESYMQPNSRSGLASNLFFFCELGFLADWGFARYLQH